MSIGLSQSRYDPQSVIHMYVLQNVALVIHHLKIIIARDVKLYYFLSDEFLDLLDSLANG